MQLKHKNSDCGIWQFVNDKVDKFTAGNPILDNTASREVTDLGYI